MFLWQLIYCVVSFSDYHNGWFTMAQVLQTNGIRSIAKRYHFCLWNFGTFLLIWKFCHLFSLHLKNKNKRNIQIRNKLLFILCLMTHYITILGFNYHHLFLFGQRSLIHYRNSQIRNKLLFIIYSMTLFITMLGSNYRHLCLFLEIT